MDAKALKLDVQVGQNVTLEQIESILLTEVDSKKKKYELQLKNVYAILKKLIFSGVLDH